MVYLKAVIVFAFLFLGMVVKSLGQNDWDKLTDEFIVEDSDVPFRQCHASTIVELAPGKLMAAWFGGSHEGGKDVVIWVSIRDRDGWSKPAAVANGVINDTLRYACWNPVLFKDQQGILHLFYKVGPDPRSWWGMEMLSRDDGKMWERPVRLPNGILGPIKNKPIQLNNDVILSPSSTETDKAWRSHIELSEDGGRTWRYVPIDTGSKLDVIQPSILEYKGGKLQALCRSKQGYVMQSWSRDKGKTWSALSPTKLINPNSGIDAVTLKTGLQLIVYNPDVPGKEWYNGRGKLRVAISGNGNDWKDIAVLEDGTVEEYSYPAVIQTADGNIHITYTFDRKNIKHVVLKQAKTVYR